MSSDVFIISSACESTVSAAIQRAVELSGVTVARVKDAIFGLDGSPFHDLDTVARAAGLTCPAVGVSTGMRALFFAAAAILSDDVESALVIGLDPETPAAILLASPEMVGRLNLLPRARLAARSLVAPIALDRTAALDEEPEDAPSLPTSDEIEISKTGDHAPRLLHELLAELESRSAHWGLLTVDGSALLIERL